MLSHEISRGIRKLFRTLVDIKLQIEFLNLKYSTHLVMELLGGKNHVLQIFYFIHLTSPLRFYIYIYIYFE